MNAVIQAVADLIEATDEFVEVRRHASPTPGQAPGLPRAEVTFEGFAVEDAQEPEDLVTTVTVRVTLVVEQRPATSSESFEALDRLTAIVRATLDRSALGGLALPGRSLVTGGRPTTRPADQSAASVALIFSCALLDESASSPD